MSRWIKGARGTAEEIEEARVNRAYLQDDDVATMSNKSDLGAAHYMSDLYALKESDNIALADAATFANRTKGFTKEDYYKFDYYNGLVSGDFIKFGEYEYEVDGSNNLIVDKDGNPVKKFKENENAAISEKYDLYYDSYVFGRNTMDHIVNQRNEFFNENRKDVKTLSDGTKQRTLEMGKYYAKSIYNYVTSNFPSYASSENHDGVYYTTNGKTGATEVYDGNILLYSIPSNIGYNTNIEIYNKSNRAYSNLGEVFYNVTMGAGAKTLFWDSPNNFKDYFNKEGARDALFNIGYTISQTKEKLNKILYSNNRNEDTYVAHPSVTPIDDIRTLPNGMQVTESGLGFRALAETLKAGANREIKINEQNDDLKHLQEQYRRMLGGYKSNPYDFNIYTKNGWADLDRKKKSEKEGQGIWLKVKDDEDGIAFKRAVIDDLQEVIQNGQYGALMARRGTEYGYHIDIYPKIAQNKGKLVTLREGYEIYVEGAFDSEFFNNYSNSTRGKAQAYVTQMEMYNDKDKEYAITYPTPYLYDKKVGAKPYEDGNIDPTKRIKVYGDANGTNYVMYDKVNAEYNLNDLFGSQETAKYALSQYIEINNVINSILDRMINYNENAQGDVYKASDAEDYLAVYLDKEDSKTGFKNAELLAIFNDPSTISYIKNSRRTNTDNNGRNVPMDNRASGALTDVIKYCNNIIDSFYTGF